MRQYFYIKYQPQKPFLEQMLRYFCFQRNKYFVLYYIKMIILQLIISIWHITKCKQVTVSFRFLKSQQIIGCCVGSKISNGFLWLSSLWKDKYLFRSKYGTTLSERLLYQNITAASGSTKPVKYVFIIFYFYMSHIHISRNYLLQWRIFVRY